LASLAYFDLVHFKYLFYNLGGFNDLKSFLSSFSAFKEIFFLLMEADGAWIDRGHGETFSLSLIHFHFHLFQKIRSKENKS
jgi:hypothetical protein